MTDNLRDMPVIFFMMDGVRPDAIIAADTPTLDGMKARGAYTNTAQSVMPSITLPCHMSIFKSVPPSRHGIVQNEYMPLARPVTGLIEHLHNNGIDSAMYYNWDFLRDVVLPGYLFRNFYSNTSLDPEGDIPTVEAACEGIAKNDAKFSFVYLGTTDSMGHAAGWMSDEYLRQIEKIDGLIAQVMQAAPANSRVLIHSDHGGHERTHGTDMPEDMNIPWMLAGPGIKEGHVIERDVSLLDTAPTIASLFGLDAHQQWEGSAVTEAYINGAG
ncbi:MAG: alkaline phosphatase family protein [Anaerolineae bacterium]|nr:alkaline phosphatase family protein [Anaerolineae bacterium]